MEINLNRHRSTFNTQQNLLQIDSSKKITKLPIKLKPEQQYLTILVITWNLMGTVPPIENLQHLLNQQAINHDMIVFGTQECERQLFLSFFCEGKQNWQLMLNNILEQNFIKVTSEALQGIHLIVFIKKDKQRYVSNVRIKKLRLGLCGIIANKGALQIRFELGSKRFLFVNLHLDATTYSNNKRNQNLIEVLTSLINKQIADEIFIFGDFNYRISIQLSREEIQQHIRNQKFLELLEKEDFRNQLNLRNFLNEYKEGEITFPPTYKLEPEKNKYYEHRNPGWTDRIFYKSQTDQLQIQQYDSDFRVFGSDHRPVYGSFYTKFNKLKSGYVKIKQSDSKCNLI